MKKLCAVLLALTMLLPLCACHGSVSHASFEVPEEFDESRQLEITFWAKNDSNAAQSAIYRQAIADFEALYPNITVTLRLYTNYSDIYNDVITNIATDTTPNVCITYPDHIATYLTGENVVVPLGELMADSRYGLGGSELKFDGVTQEEIVGEFLDECAISGEYYALPFMRSTEACYINKTYVEALGYTVPDVLTWDFIWEVSDAAMALNEDGTYAVNGQEVLIPFLYKSTDYMMIQYLQQAGGGYSTDSGEILLFNDTTADFLYTIAEHVAAGSFSTFKISSYPANFLNAGQCIFAIDSTAGSTWMGSEAPLLDIPEDQIVEFETVVRAVPQVDTENVQMISQGPSICVFNKADSQEVLASWLFAQFLLTNPVQIAYAETEGYLPVTTRAQRSEEYQDYLSRAGEDNETYYSVKIAATELLLDNIANTFTTPVFNGSASVRDAAGQLIEEVVKSVRRKTSVDEAYIESLYADIISLYRLDQLQTGTGSSGKIALGALPAGAVALLAGLATCWICIGIYAAILAIRKKKQE